MKKIHSNKYGLDLDGDWKKASLPHTAAARLYRVASQIRIQ